MKTNKKLLISMDTYYDMINSGEILPPQYMDGNSPNKTDWLDSVKKQAEISKNVRFLGEMNLTNLNDNIKGGTEKNSLSDKGTNNLNTYLQGLINVEGAFNFNNNTNWLFFNDNGVEKLVAKKPLKYDMSWNRLYNAGVVFGEEGIKDLINADFSNTDYYKSYQMGEDAGKGQGTPKTYKPQYVSINGRTYIVRLMRAYNENEGINYSRYWSLNSANYYDATKGSEWNRLILSLINPDGDDNDKGYNNGTNGRYGSETKDSVESNMPVLANYSWWKDFGGNSDSSGNYDKDIFYYGAYRLMQETGHDGVLTRAVRGADYSYIAGAYLGYGYPCYGNLDFGWIPVLERIS